MARHLAARITDRILLAELNESSDSGAGDLLAECYTAKENSNDSGSYFSWQGSSTLVPRTTDRTLLADRILGTLYQRKYFYWEGSDTLVP